MATNSIFLPKYSTEDFDLYLSVVKNERVMKYINGKTLTEQEDRAKFESILPINDKEELLGYFKKKSHLALASDFLYLIKNNYALI